MWRQIDLLKCNLCRSGGRYIAECKLVLLWIVQLGIIASYVLRPEPLMQGPVYSSICGEPAHCQAAANSVLVWFSKSSGLRAVHATSLADSAEGGHQMHPPCVKDMICLLMSLSANDADSLACITTL